jgi:dipeptidase E
MKFLLTSQSIHNESIANALRELVGKPTREAKLVYIPTSCHATFGDKTWFVENMVNVHRMGWQSFKIVDLVAMDGFPKEKWWPSLEEADVIFVGGGTNFYLGYWLERSGLAAALPELIKDKVSVGSSAGSMYMTQSLRFASQAMRQLQEGKPFNLDILGPEGQSSGKALGLVDIEFRPHYLTENLFIDDALLTKAAQGLTAPLYAVDDESALKIVDGTVEVVSEGKWHMFEPGLEA